MNFYSSNLDCCLFVQQIPMMNMFIPNESKVEIHRHRVQSLLTSRKSELDID
jgi:hypothetical protein